MTSFDDVTIVLTKFEYSPGIALAQSFSLIHWLLWSDIMKKYIKCIKGNNSGKNGNFE